MNDRQYHNSLWLLQNRRDNFSDEEASALDQYLSAWGNNDLHLRRKDSPTMIATAEAAYRRVAAIEAEQRGLKGSL